jgi:hypothetical protein
MRRKTAFMDVVRRPVLLVDAKHSYVAVLDLAVSVVGVIERTVIRDRFKRLSLMIHPDTDLHVILGI